MKTNESKWQKSYTGWIRRVFHRRPVVDGVIPDDCPNEEPEQHLNPLDHIQEHLRHHGLDQLVRVRCAPEGGGFVLEDADGYVHATDYAAAVAVIERIWLYQP